MSGNILRRECFRSQQQEKVDRRKKRCHALTTAKNVSPKDSGKALSLAVIIASNLQNNTERRGIWDIHSALVVLHRLLVTIKNKKKLYNQDVKSGRFIMQKKIWMVC